MTPHINRRTLLQGAMVGAVAAIAGPSGAHAASSAADHAGALPAPGFWNKPTSLGRQDRVFLERGLVHGAWVRSGSSDGWIPSAKLWNGAGFTTPQFYCEHLAASANKVLEYSDEVVRGRATSGWALARAPYGGHIDPDFTAYPGTGFPDTSVDWMTEAMRAHARELHTACFGDEEAYSPDRVAYLTDAYAALRERYPWVLVHNNQTLAQYSPAQLSEYVQTARPDMLTWDWYPWQRNPQHPGGRPDALLQHIARYRAAAVAGWDGAGEEPITFGQYTTGFRVQPERPADDTQNLNRFKRRVNLSESQLNLVPYLTWAAGGKWLSLFRWELDEDYYSPTAGATWETDGLFLTDAQERPLPAYRHYARINHDMTVFSPYLTRLRTRTIGRVPGRDRTGRLLGAAGVETWTEATDPASGLARLVATNLGGANGGQPGDVFVGSFREIPGLSAGENRGVLPDRAGAAAFMLVNAMTAGLVDYNDPNSAGGTGAQTRQRLEVTVVPASVQAAGGRALYRLDRRSGRPVEVPLAGTGGERRFTMDIDGGAGELFFWG